MERGLNKKKINLKNYKMVIVPINIEKAHWLLLVADLVNEQFYIVDSMKTSMDSA